jgi:hypothetical protein
LKFVWKKKRGSEIEREREPGQGERGRRVADSSSEENPCFPLPISCKGNPPAAFIYVLQWKSPVITTARQIPDAKV